jgi:hypothetical protein
MDRKKSGLIYIIMIFEERGQLAIRINYDILSPYKDDNLGVIEA